MTERASLSSHAVAHVEAFEGAQQSVTREFVQCPRTGQSVPTKRCLTCPAAVSFAYAENGSLKGVTCGSVAPPAGPALERPNQFVPLRRLSVADLMSRNVVCMRPHLSLDAAMQLFLETGLRAAPVVNEHGAVLGMLEESDLQLAVQAHAGRRGEEEAAICVGDLMMPVAFAVHEHTPATQAAGLMVYEAVRRVPVVSPDGTVVGVLSAADLLYWLARSDGYVLPAPGPKRAPQGSERPLHAPIADSRGP
ncbi:MAG: CBS domain-containing protein [Myxococcales bacterium]